MFFFLVSQDTFLSQIYLLWGFQMDCHYLDGDTASLHEEIIALSNWETPPCRAMSPPATMHRTTRVSRRLMFLSYSAVFFFIFWLVATTFTTLATGHMTQIRVRNVLCFWTSFRFSVRDTVTNEWRSRRQQTPFFGPSKATARWNWVQMNSTPSDNLFLTLFVWFCTGFQRSNSI